MSLLSSRRTVLGLVAALAVVAPAGADTVTSVNGIYQDTTGVTSTSPPTATACSGSVSCYFVFNKVPTGKQFIARHVSCQINMSAGEVTQIVLEVQKNDGNWLERFQMLPSTQRPSTTPGFNVVVNEDILQVIAQGQRPEVFIQGDGTLANFIGNCSISGDLVSVP